MAPVVSSPESPLGCRRQPADDGGWVGLPPGRGVGIRLTRVGNSGGGGIKGHGHERSVPCRFLSFFLDDGRSAVPGREMRYHPDDILLEHIKHEHENEMTRSVVSIIRYQRIIHYYWSFDRWTSLSVLARLEGMIQISNSVII